MELIEDEFFSDDSDSAESTSSLTGRHNYDATKFSNVYEHKQVETLRFLRQTLKENKILKRRLNMVELELERFQDFKAFYPAKDTLEEQLDRPKSSESPINEAFLITTDDKECQTDLMTLPLVNNSSPVNRSASGELSHSPPIIVINSENSDLGKSQDTFTQVTEMVEVVEEDKEDDTELVVYQMPEIVMLDKGCQCAIELKVAAADTVSEGNNAESSEALANLQIDKRALEDEKNCLNDEIGNLHQKIHELKMNNKHTMEKYDAMMSSHELTNGLLNESNCQLLALKTTNSEFEEFKARFNLLEATNTDLHKEIVHCELQLKNKVDEIEKLNETLIVLTANFAIMDQQRQKIEFLEAECEKHLTEKHAECERRINELTQECQNNVGFIQAQKNELSTLNSQISDMEKSMERSKMELQSFNFKEFIAVKRELAQIKQEKEKQFAKFAKKQQEKEVAIIKATPQPQPLPPIKDNPVQEKNPKFKFFH